METSALWNIFLPTKVLPSSFCRPCAHIFSSLEYLLDVREMRPLIVGIGGGHSGAGKTSVACKILRKLPGWGAIKYTRTAFYESITDDLKVISEKGKDTRRFLDSGAGRVIWIRAPFHGLPEILPMALEMLSNLKGMVVEGNSAVEILNPDIVIFVSGTEGKMKRGAKKILTMADIVVFDGEPPAGTPPGAERFRKEETDKVPGFLLKILKSFEDKAPKTFLGRERYGENKKSL